MGAAPVIAPSGFREYDLRWRFPEEIDLAGMAAVGRGLGTQLLRRGGDRRIVAGHDLRSYSPAVHAALVSGLAAAGCDVHDIGLAVTPMAYFARAHLGIGAVAMVTASHNPNGWTGVKAGFTAPFTHGPADIAELRDIVLGQAAVTAAGGRVTRCHGLREPFIDACAGGFRARRRLRVVCATGNGTAGLFAPLLLERLGAEVVPLHTEPDTRFPHYNPNPEALEMLQDMARAVRAAGADLALGFDGDGDRLGVVDDRGEALFADKLGVLLARGIARGRPGSLFLADVKSTGLFATDPVLAALGGRVEYVRVGHSHVKRLLAARGAAAAFEKSGHIYLAPPLGRGYDCALSAATLVLRMLDEAGDAPLSALAATLPGTFLSPTMCPHCPDGEKYAAADRIAARLQALFREGGTLGGRRILGVTETNGARVALEGGGWALVRASSNTPNLVVVCESPESRDHLAAIFADVDALIRCEPSVGAYDQGLEGPQTT
ncbi:MAG: phosphomannomutase/phosphoglucomutase [Rhodobacteraceae bacterium]|nr:phosphomannomutase/phosphoglucomutase [Paracoccaceae bacterium]